MQPKGRPQIGRGNVKPIPFSIAFQRISTVAFQIFSIVTLIRPRPPSAQRPSLQEFLRSPIESIAIAPRHPSGSCPGFMARLFSTTVGRSQRRNQRRSWTAGSPTIMKNLFDHYDANPATGFPRKAEPRPILNKRSLILAGHTTTPISETSLAELSSIWMLSRSTSAQGHNGSWTCPEVFHPL